MNGEPRPLRSRRDDPQTLAAGVRRGDLRAIARLITFAERDEAAVAEVMPLLQPHTGRAHIVGITGAPGCGKSTLVDQVIAIARAATLRVGVVAVAPSNPFTRGAILADRLRMQRHSTDTGTFIRIFAAWPRATSWAGSRRPRGTRCASSTPPVTT